MTNTSIGMACLAIVSILGIQLVNTFFPSFSHNKTWSNNLKYNRYSPNKLLIGLNIGFIIVTLAATLIEWFAFDPFLQFVTLFYGVFIGWYGIMDIWDDTISRTVEGSDAYACFQMWKCCLPRCVGVQFAILAIICQCAGLYFAMLSMES